MKRITILVIAMASSFAAFAQYNQGRMLVGGSFGLSTNTSKTRDGNQTVTRGTQTVFNLSPRFGYFIIDNLAIGAGVGLGLAKWNSKNNGTDYNTSSISFQPFVRYYLPVNVFFHGELGIGTSRTKFEGQSFADDKHNTFNFGLGAGYALFLNDNVAVEPMLSYKFTRSKYDEDDERELNSGLFLSVGFQIYLGNK
jgi:opacity protein-like surface antigen